MIKQGKIVNLMTPALAAFMLSSAAFATAETEAVSVLVTENGGVAQTSEQPLESLPEYLREEIVQLSGLAGLSLQARNLAQQELNRQQAALGFQYQVATRVAGLWSPQRLTERLVQPLMSYDQGQLQQLVSILNSDLMQLARGKETAAVNSQGSPDFMNYVEKLRSQPASTTRLTAVSDLDQAMHFSDMLLKTRASVYLQLQAVIKDWQPPLEWQQRLRTEVQEFLLYTYRHTPTSEVNLLIQEYQQPPIQLWLQTLSERLQHMP